MQFRRIFKRKKWLLIVPSVVWWFIWELTKDSIMESTRDWFAKQDGLMVFLDWLLQHPGIIAIVFILGVFIWAYHDTNKESIVKGELKIEVISSNVLDFYPQPKNPVLNFLGKSNILEIRTKFKPKGNVQLREIELHLGIHTFQADHLPITLLENEDIYAIAFTVQRKIIQTALKDRGKSNYLRVLYDGIDCRSKHFSLGLAYKI